jgi:hypothetical protein
VCHTSLTTLSTQEKESTTTMFNRFITRNKHVFVRALATTATASTMYFSYHHTRQHYLHYPATTTTTLYADSNQQPPSGILADFEKTKEDWSKIMSTSDEANYPFFKYVLLTVGTTSAGKSSLCNHLFGIPIKETADSAVDDQYTIMETISEAEFKKIVTKYNSNTLEDYQVIGRPDRWNADPRRGIVYTVLTGKDALSRYPQVVEKVQIFFECFSSINQ